MVTNPEGGWDEGVVRWGRSLHRGPRGADGRGAGLGADLRGRPGAGAIRVPPGTERPRRCKAGRTLGPERAYRGGRRRPFRLLRRDPARRVDEVVVPAHQRSLRVEADQDVAGGSGGGDRRAGPSSSDDPEYGRGAREP